MISYNVIVGDTITRVLVRLSGISSFSPVASREFVIIATTILVTLPLSLCK